MMLVWPGDLLTRAIIIVAVVVGLMLAGAGIHKRFSDRKIARIEAAYQERVLEATQKRLAAEAMARAVERRWQQDVREREEEYAVALRKRDVVMRDLVAAGNGLRNALARYSSDGGAAANPAAAIGDLRHRVETVGALLAEVDRLAEDSSRAADALRDELSLCRGYATSVAAK